MTDEEKLEVDGLKTEIALLKSRLVNAYSACLKCEKECSTFETVYRLEVKDCAKSKWHRVLDNVTYHELKRHLDLDYRTKDLVASGRIRIKSRNRTNWIRSDEEFFQNTRRDA